jgi:hypothetical protein
VKKQNRIATHFYFEGLILYGDVTKENGLRISGSFGEEPTEV